MALRNLQIAMAAQLAHLSVMKDKTPKSSTEAEVLLDKFASLPYIPTNAQRASYKRHDADAIKAAEDKRARRAAKRLKCGVPIVEVAKP